MTKTIKTVTLLGAGGKMGMRLTRNLVKTEYLVDYVEISSEGRERLKSTFGIDAKQDSESIRTADAVILAVPDVALEKVSSQVIPMMAKGSMAVTLDPAAALAGKLFNRDDISYFIAHPSHPSIFSWEPTEEAHRDYFGGISARQTIVCALMKGEEEMYHEGVKLSSAFYAPVSVAHRITVEQMGLLEPALVETLASTCVYVIRQGLDEVIKKGVPSEAARDFLLGHLKIQMAVLFDMIPGAVFSDAANKALQRGLNEFIRPDWKKVFDSDNVADQIKSIT